MTPTHGIGQCRISIRWLQHPDVFGRTILENGRPWREWIAHQANLDSQYAGPTEEAAIGLADPITNDTLPVLNKSSNNWRQWEAEMATKLKEIDDNKNNPVKTDGWGNRH